MTRELLTGLAGSGKTRFILDRFRESPRAKESGVRLLVPTATMAEHLRHQMAREGLVFRPELILTLSRFIEPWVEDLAQISKPAFYLLVEQVVRRVNRPEFARVAHMPGFCACLAAALQEFSKCETQTPLSDAFRAISAEVNRKLRDRGLAMRSERLERAASSIEQGGLDGIKTVWLDGFFSMSDAELSVIRAIAKHADVTVTLPSAEVTSPARRKLLGMGFTERHCTGSRAEPAVELFRARNMEKEAEEIARRIVEQAGAGRLFREIGIIVRNPESYVPVLRAALERFGIPARFYFDSELIQHSVIRYLAGAVDAMLGGWDYAQTLAVLRLAPEVSDVIDRFDFLVRERIPGRGLEGLLALAGQAGMPVPTEINSWRFLELTPSQWAERAKSLRGLFRPQRPADSPTHEQAALWRGQATALDSFDAAMEEAAKTFESAGPVPLAEFWRAAKAVLRLTPLRIRDQRRNVVHVLSVYEARQWELPVVFVCGLVEGQFPLFRKPNPFFPAADFEREEEFLFDSAVTRATSQLVLSYPEFDSRRSIFLDRFKLPLAEARPQVARPRPHSQPPAAIRSPELLQVLADRHASISPTSLESFLHCPFQFFGRKTLRLEAAPVRPEERLDFLEQGNIVHRVLAQYRDGEPLESLFERVFREICAAKQIPEGYRTESVRLRLLEDLHRFIRDTRWPRGLDRRTEQTFEFRLNDSVSIRGRIDRLDVAPDGRAFVIDYKYSGSQSTKDRMEDEALLQPQLYILAVERAFGLTPAGMFYCGLRGGVRYAGWSRPDAEFPGKLFTREWLDVAVRTSLEAASRIRQGEIAPNPSDPDLCPRCEYRDVCRFAAQQALGLPATPQ